MKDQNVTIRDLQFFQVGPRMLHLLMMPTRKDASGVPHSTKHLVDLKGLSRNCIAIVQGFDYLKDAAGEIAFHKYYLPLTTNHDCVDLFCKR
jgi:hypothetical protein